MRIAANLSASNTTPLPICDAGILPATPKNAPRKPAPQAFTLVEILIVVVILGILAAIVVPQFASASQQTRENSLKMDLYRIRQQLSVYKAQHNGDWPALSDFTNQLTLASDVSGQTAPDGTSGYRFGPYLEEIPMNPFTEANKVTDQSAGQSDWYYNESTGDFRANDSTDHRTY